ncbi:hypothetical protein Tco_0859885 [Tanacetum coccineum]|uniref:Uncharacterized protein n=1 Tax=Tanacetum coccineum TaxID=301880 RepID=A0ABQ5BH57_9ASTR
MCPCRCGHFQQANFWLSTSDGLKSIDSLVFLQFRNPHANRQQFPSRNNFNQNRGNNFNQRLAERSITERSVFAEDVFVNVGNSNFSDFVVEAITFNLDQTSKIHSDYNNMTVNKIGRHDMACDEFSRGLAFQISVLDQDFPDCEDSLACSIPQEFHILSFILGIQKRISHQKTENKAKKMTKPGTEWKSCEGQSQIKAKDQKSQSQSQLNKLTVKTGAVIEEYYWMRLCWGECARSQPI